MSEAMTLAGKTQEQMAKLGRDFSNRSESLTAAVERGDVVYVRAMYELYRGETQKVVDGLALVVAEMENAARGGRDIAGV